MNVSRIQHNYDNMYLNKNNNIMFKGNVSTEFVKYTDTLRNDCLGTVRGYSSNPINYMRNRIIDKASRLMQNYFPKESTLSVDTKTSQVEDFITYANKAIRGYDTAYIVYLIPKNATPIHRLCALAKAVLSGRCFSGASVKEYVRMYYVTDYLESGKLYDENFVKGSMSLLEFYKNKINLLKSEINAEDYCVLKTQADYEDLLSKLKGLSK